jgi:anhydro-N-acetylmuramic acid kinase
MIKPVYKVVGVMSGSSLDGLDLALCELQIDDGQWKFRIEKAVTEPYSTEFRQRLVSVMDGSALELARLHAELGRIIGDACKQFIGDINVDLIASHGHTIFHAPAEGLTTQIGCGATIAAITGITTVCDFRTMDVALGGQGAPLVPLGEKLLFPEHECFINLGGISNISVHHKDRVLGFDIGPCNMALNFLATEAGKSFDRNGEMASNGKIIPELLDRLNALPFYQQNPPRSLGREWFDHSVLPLIDKKEFELSDRMRTVVEHIAQQIARELDRSGVKKVMVTGGGAHNSFLMGRLRSLTTTTIQIPEKEVVDLKEALIFSLLGVLRIRGEVNALASVTGAKRDSVGGAVYWGRSVGPI